VLILGLLRDILGIIDRWVRFRRSTYLKLLFISPSKTTSGDGSIPAACAAEAQCRQRFRFVRRLPSGADVPGFCDACGQALDKPLGRKPRGSPMRRRERYGICSAAVGRSATSRLDDEGMTWLERLALGRLDVIFPWHVRQESTSFERRAKRSAIGAGCSRADGGCS